MVSIWTHIFARTDKDFCFSRSPSCSHVSLAFKVIFLTLSFYPSSYLIMVKFHFTAMLLFWIRCFHLAYFSVSLTWPVMLRGWNWAWPPSFSLFCLVLLLFQYLFAIRFPGSIPIIQRCCNVTYFGFLTALTLTSGELESTLRTKYTTAHGINPSCIALAV